MVVITHSASAHLQTRSATERSFSYLASNVFSTVADALFETGVGSCVLPPHANPSMTSTMDRTAQIGVAELRLLRCRCAVMSVNTVTGYRHDLFVEHRTVLSLLRVREEIASRRDGAALAATVLLTKPCQLPRSCRPSAASS
jgi:hypothetical protein